MANKVSKKNKGTSHVDELLINKQKVTDNLINLEKQIYILEEVYLEDTEKFGNVLKGFDGFMQNLATQNTEVRRQSIHSRNRIKDSDHIFSASSTMYKQFLAPSNKDLTEDTNTTSSAITKPVKKTIAKNRRREAGLKKQNSNQPSYTNSKDNSQTIISTPSSSTKKRNRKDTNNTTVSSNISDADFDL